MARFFHSPYPTFKSYKNPQHSTIEASPYFWWWYALTLNTDYRHVCELGTADGFDARVQQVFKDWGDTRYEGCRYRAFTRWWTERVNTTEQRGVYLFAEPHTQAAVSVIQRLDEADAALANEDVLLIAVNTAAQRKHIDKRIDRELKRRMGKLNKGKQVRNPKLSQARYSLTKPVLATALKKTFAVYDIRAHAAAVDKKITNTQVAELAKLDYRQRVRHNEAALEGAQERRVISAIVARHWKAANTMIANSAVGVFPTRGAVT